MTTAWLIYTNNLLPSITKGTVEQRWKETRGGFNTEKQGDKMSPCNVHARAKVNLPINYTTYYLQAGGRAAFELSNFRSRPKLWHQVGGAVLQGTQIHGRLVVIYCQATS